MQLALSGNGREIGRRLIALVDNTTTLGAVAKGRSSSWVLNKLCRRISAVSLLSNIAVIGHWVPSTLNPADPASRGKDGPSKHDS